jgi:hypothetical protein
MSLRLILSATSGGMLALALPTTLHAQDRANGASASAALQRDGGDHDLC